MNDILYILVREDNQAFISAFDTYERAKEAAKTFRVPTEILHWVVNTKPLPVIDSMKLDKICWMTDEGCEWLGEDVAELTEEYVRDYVNRTKAAAEKERRKNGEEEDLCVYFEIGSLLRFEAEKRRLLINDVLEELGA